MAKNWSLDERKRLHSEGKFGPQNIAMAQPVGQGYGYGYGGYGGGGYGGPGGGGGAPVNFEAQRAPELDALLKRHTDYLDTFKEGTGHFLDVVGQKARDAREGGRTALQQTEGLRGIGSSNRLGKFDAET